MHVLRSALPLFVGALLAGCSSIEATNVTHQAQHGVVDRIAMPAPAAEPAVTAPPAAARMAPAPIAAPSATWRVTDGTAQGIPGDMLAEAVTAFAAYTDDPQSVQMRQLRLFKMPDSGYETICGEYNAKGPSGQYVGFQPFQYLPPYHYAASNHFTCEDVTFKPLPEFRAGTTAQLGG